MVEPDGLSRWLMADFGGDLASPIPPGPSWQTEAACLGHDPSWWFPSKLVQTTAMAKAVCAGCPVREQCLELALAELDVADGDTETTALRFGILGGLSPKERTALARQRARQAA